VVLKYHSIGRLCYSVKREGSDQKWWAILDCDPEIGRYYRHLYRLHHRFCRKLDRPFWGPHITVCRNERPDEEYLHLWGQYESELVEFHYLSGVKDNYGPERYRTFYWLDVLCPRLDEIREELGLGPPARSYHLTIGSWENPARETWYLEHFKN